MAFIRITSITNGAIGTKLHSESHPEAGSYITSEFAYDCGLLKNSAWLYSIELNDTLIIPTKKVEEIRANLKGVATFEVERPKYCNHSVGSDRYPFEIIEWKSDTCLVVRELEPVGFRGYEDGHCESYRSEPKNPLITVREHKNGGLYEAGTTYCPYILSEEPYYFRDPSF